MFFLKKKKSQELIFTNKPISIFVKLNSASFGRKTFIPIAIFFSNDIKYKFFAKIMRDKLKCAFDDF